MGRQLGEETTVSEITRGVRMRILQKIIFLVEQKVVNIYTLFQFKAGLATASYNSMQAHYVKYTLY